MTLEEYAAQQAQQAQEPQQANQLDAVAARIDAEKLSLLMADARQIIDEYRSPATLLTLITGAMFGDGSAEAAAVAAAIDADRNPGGHEMAIAELRQRRKMLNQQAKQLTEQQKAITAELEKLNEAERELMNQQTQAATLDSALTAVLTFCKGIDERETLLKEAAELYQKHRSTPAAMGLLYGSLSELTRQQYTRFDLVQQQELQQLKEQVLAAAAGNPQK